MGWPNKEGKPMKNLLLAGTAGLLLAFGAAGASAQTIYQGDRPVYVAPEPMIEGRSAYIDEPAVVVHPRYYYGPRHYYYERDHAPFPFSALPWNW
jgi:hypothetical protein